MTRDPIARAFDRLVQRDPAAPLVLTPERRATVGDVEALAQAAGSVTAAAGLAPGTLIGLVAPNGPGMLASLVALARAGIAVLLLDGQTPEAEGMRIAHALGAAALLRCHTGWPAGPADWSLAPAASEPRWLPDTAVVKLTSGSTGAPRGIATSAEALLADDEALTATMGIGPDDRLLATVPFSHSYGLSSLVIPCLVRGTVLVMPEESSLFDPFFAGRQAGATVFPSVPAYLDALLRLSEPTPPPPGLRLVLTAGAPLRPETSLRFRETFGLPVHVFYGASECGGICYDREGGAAERGTVGAPVEGVRVTLAPEEHDEAEGGHPGEGIVTVESAAVARGYLPDPEPRLQDGRFVAGDRAVWRDGELALLGRRDDQVNIKGKKVNPREVEGVLAQLQGVDEVAVLGVPAPRHPQQGELLRAVVACRPGRLTAEDVLGWCRSRLAPHKVPRSIILVPELPRTSRGKLDRPALRALGGGG
ncbi:MAG TPA: class I adenylate-forming enzyme family protein [Thermoanaerobaculia bacterium]|nr:class I adenylate-forming enzyme family protein [Thermoanaerobaculia bacterium]